MQAKQLHPFEEKNNLRGYSAHLSVCVVEKIVERVLLWPKFLDAKKSELALEETFVIGEDIMRAHLTVS